MNLYDPRKDERVKVPDQTLSEELRCSMKMGSSRGWVGMKNLEDSTMRLTNIFNPCASVSSHKVISLPPLADSEAHISSISLSASPDKQDCVVAAKSFSPFLSLCRPGDSEWTHVKARPFSASKVMYSGRDRKFYLLHNQSASNEEYEGPMDLTNTSSDDFTQVSVFQRFPNSGIPESRQDQLVSGYSTQYLVESPSGDSFIVYWFKNLSSNKGQVESDPTSSKIKPRAFMVFRQDPEKKMGCYTEDIGDLCIFLGMSEAFCVSAKEYPGLKPNSVYYAELDLGFGFYDLSSNTLHDVIDPHPSSVSYHWLAPLQ